jgi:hypothetical protein
VPASSQMIGRAARFDKTPGAPHTCRMSARAPLPLLVGFGVFVAGLAYLVTASLARRDAPVFSPSAPARVRAQAWARAGDTLTLDATDGERWRYASLARGGALAGDDTAAWEIAARRYRVTVPPGAALADLGAVPFDSARVGPGASFIPSAAGESANAAMGHWYRYSLVTHLLMPGGHVYALRAADGTLWKLEVVGYYCPGLVAGCLTLRYAPLTAPAAAREPAPRRDG